MIVKIISKEWWELLCKIKELMKEIGIVMKWDYYFRRFIYKRSYYKIKWINMSVGFCW